MLQLLLVLAAAAIWLAWRTKPPPDEDDPDEIPCPNCGYDLRASHGRCPECGRPFLHPNDHHPLRDDWPADAIKPRAAKPGEIQVVLHTTDNRWEATMLAEQLRVRGIAAHVTERPVIADNTPYAGGAVLGSHRVVVWSGDEEIARELRDKLLQRQAEAQGQTPSPRTPGEDGGEGIL